MTEARAVSLDDKYVQTAGEVYLSAMHALVRLPMLQAERDRHAALTTGGFISGYRGSPIGGYDRELFRARARLAEFGVRFEPGLNEEMAASACWGTQQVGLFPDPRVQGVFSLWYGKSPGLDRAMDAIKHAAHAGTSAYGGVLAVVGDDHLAKSSAFGHQSEYNFVDCAMPVLVPSDISEILRFGLAGWALSRYCGTWVGFKLAGSLCESSAFVTLPPTSEPVPSPDFVLPPDGVHLRWPDSAAAMESRSKAVRLPAAQAFVRAAGLDRIIESRSPGRIGIVAPGRTFNVVREALRELGLPASEHEGTAVRLLKPALVWPLDPERVLQFLRGLDLVLVVEDKRPLVEDQIKVLLHDRGMRDVRVIGKRDERGAPLLPESGEIDALEVALALAPHLPVTLHRRQDIEARLAARNTAPAVVRMPYFCSGCPHNTSTRVPDESIAIGGIGCHTLTMGMERGMLTFSHMGGEGGTWLGIAPFTGMSHVFQNMGDGTYQHSGYLGIRAAVAANSTITFKILYNDAVAMTGGQAIEGQPTVPQISRQLAAEGVRTIAVVSDEPDKYTAEESFAPGTTRHHRDDLEQVQRRLQAAPGVSALIYDQTCAAEKRRRRKIGAFPDPARRVFINEAVCEGCGDCGRQSNCLSIVPVDSLFGRKRQIDQASCNKDYSCTKGFCPSFVTIEGGKLRKPAPRPWGDLPAPPAHAGAADGVTRILLAGIGGTGIVTVGAILGTAARIDGAAAAVNDVTGMAQKGGPVLGHVQIAREASSLLSDRLPLGATNLLIAADLVVSTMPDAMSRLGRGTVAWVNTDATQTGEFARHVDADVDGPALMARLQGRVGSVSALPALRAAEAASGDPVGATLLLLGAAVQGGLVPISVESIEAAIRLNGVAVDRNLAALNWGRKLALEPAALDDLGVKPSLPTTLEERIEAYVQFLTVYQSAAYAQRFRSLVERARAAEASKVPGASEFAHAVAASAARLMAYKDEYEVARLQSAPEFAQRLRDSFEGPFAVKYHLAPPFLAKPDPVTGVPRKIAFSERILPAFRVLARLRGLRGTWFDPFGRTEERRRERQMIVDFEALVEHLGQTLTLERHARSVELAALPQTVRGYGHVKMANVQRFEARRAELLGQL